MNRYDSILEDPHDLPSSKHPTIICFRDTFDSGTCAFDAAVTTSFGRDYTGTPSDLRGASKGSH